jgi:repressor LexA
MIQSKFEPGSGNLGTPRDKSRRLGRTKMSLTEKQAIVLRFIEDHINDVGIPPTVREIAIYFTISSKAAHDHIKAIAKKGYIRTLPGAARAIVLLKSIKGENNE